MRAPRLTIRILMLLVAISAVYTALMMSVLGRLTVFLTLVLTLPVAGFVIFKRLGKHGIEGSILGGQILGLLPGLYLLFVGIFVRHFRFGSGALFGVAAGMSFAVILGGGLGALIGLVAEYLTWLLFPLRVGEPREPARAACPQGSSSGSPSIDNSSDAEDSRRHGPVEMAPDRVDRVDLR